MNTRTITTAQATDLRDGMETDRALLAQQGYQEDANALLEAVDTLEGLLQSALRRQADVVVEEEFLEAISLYSDINHVL